MAKEVPRAASWKGEIPQGACCDLNGQYDYREPLDVVFNVIPKSTPTQDLVQYFKYNNGLKASALCVASDIGTVSSTVCRQVSLQLSDDVVARLLDSLKSQPDGFVIYDLSKTELFSNTTMWSAVSSNAPEISRKWLFLGFCYNFQHAAEILDNAVQNNFRKRHRCGLITWGLAVCTLGMSILCNISEKYKLVNVKKCPRDITLSHAAYSGIVTA